MPIVHSIPFLHFSGDHLRSTMQWGSLGVQFGDHLRSGDHHYSFHRHLRSLNERVANQSSPKNSNLVSSTRRLFLSRWTHATTPNIWVTWCALFHETCPEVEILKSFLNGALTRGRFYRGKANIHWWWVEFNLYFVGWFEHKPGSLFSWVAGCGFSSDGMFLCKMNIKICLEDLLSFCCSGIV